MCKRAYFTYFAYPATYPCVCYLRLGLIVGSLPPSASLLGSRSAACDSSNSQVTNCDAQVDGCAIIVARGLSMEPAFSSPCAFHGVLFPSVARCALSMPTRNMKLVLSCDRVGACNGRLRALPTRRTCRTHCRSVAVAAVAAHVFADKNLPAISSDYLVAIDRSEKRGNVVQGVRK
ncbi:hypothetical protein BC834DRAFT_882616 [Gloeopeniophorella convolvens]|nr:hypothetical protein BC834DRAFT_882616 [Gloeopeniophorella convolvens]